MIDDRTHGEVMHIIKGYTEGAVVSLVDDGLFRQDMKTGVVRNRSYRLSQSHIIEKGVTIDSCVFRFTSGDAGFRFINYCTVQNCQFFYEDHEEQAREFQEKMILMGNKTSDVLSETEVNFIKSMCLYFAESMAGDGEPDYASAEQLANSTIDYLESLENG